MDKRGNNCDEIIRGVRNMLWGKKNNNHIDTRISKIIHQKAAMVMWEIHPDLYIPYISQQLESLADRYNHKYGIKIQQQFASNIQDFLKGFSPHGKGAPPKNYQPPSDINWQYVIDNM